MANKRISFKVEGTKHKKTFSYSGEDQLLNLVDNWLYDLEVKGDIRDANLIQKIFKAKENTKNTTEIGLYKPEILLEDKIIKKQDLKEIYCLHSKSFQVPKEFKIMAKTKVKSYVRKRKGSKKHD